MARSHEGLPKASLRRLSKLQLLEHLRLIDDSSEKRRRVLSMETSFRKKIQSHITCLPDKDAFFVSLIQAPTFYSFMLVKNATKKSVKSKAIFYLQNNFLRWRLQQVEW